MRRSVSWSRRGRTTLGRGGWSRNRGGLGSMLVSGVALLLFVFLYAFRPWRSTRQGRAVMTSAVGKVILIDALALPFAMFGDYPGRPVVRLVGFAIFTAGSLYLLVSMLLTPGSRMYPPWNWKRSRMLEDRERP